jgi:hypothetical protein
MKKLFGLFSRNREILKGKVKVFFSEQNMVVPQIQWKTSQHSDNDTICLALYFYARILFELAELNETRVARELMAFVARIATRLANPASGSGRLQIPLGKLHFAQELTEPAQRLYQADFYANQNGGKRIDLQSVIGKENYYLPASALALMQFCIQSLPESHLPELARVLDRLHQYYRLRRDFWESASLAEGPTFAMGQAELSEAELTLAPEDQS